MTSVPVLVGVNLANLAKWQEFAGDIAHQLPPEPGAIRDWCEAAILRTRHAALAAAAR